MRKLAEAFDQICYLANDGELEALQPSPGFSNRSIYNSDLSYWEELSLNYSISFAITAERVQDLPRKLNKPLDHVAMAGIPDPDIFFS